MKKMFVLFLAFAFVGTMALFAQDAGSGSAAPAAPAAAPADAGSGSAAPVAAPATEKVEAKIVVEKKEGAADVVLAVVGEAKHVLTGDKVAELLKVADFDKKVFVLEVVKGEKGCELKSFEEKKEEKKEAGSGSAAGSGSK